ncbi:uncharacterized protein LOC117333331 [Pecten maximus]|uniref:uncharacterized protein LOC117333331 n=1 Tax=Pecten maximus TaxID=6579 RepID=UPI001458C089|nr:uncharacterized protein LOC117333331 [Pecten maximus]XP_033748482.1 uncharacterized protein LOC117333331 [Pecten maximus]
MHYVKKQNLTGEGFSLLLDLIECHCKEDNLLPKTVFNLKQWFQELHIKPNKHHYCGKCLLSIPDDCDTCPNTKCNRTFSNKNERSFFVEVSLIEQLKKLYAQSDFRKVIATQFERARQNFGKITDITDGEFYKTSSFSKHLSPNDLTFTWNTDGVPLFKSSKSSMWPLFLSINELPYKMRRNPENLLLIGLWIGPKKPEMMTFLQPFIDDFLQLENGIHIDITNDSGAHMPMTFRGFLLSGTADLPAKCTVHNMIQFNGKNSCPYCLQTGETEQAGKGVCHVFPFNFDGPTEPKRSHDEAMQFAEIACNNGKPEFGIKGPCWFMQLSMYDFVKSNCIDYMHCVLLGVTKRLINLWFSKENCRKKFSFWNKFDEVNQKMLNLKPPLTITRPPRALSELKYWKASEYRSFLLFYGPVILLNALSSEYYFHFLLLSEAVFILLKDSIEFQELDRAENLLEHFVATFTGLYEPRYLTLNFHLLLHLTDNVRQLGPIWGYSCFPFEDANGFLMNLVKGTQSVHCQLVDSMAIMHGLPYLKKNCVVTGSKADHFLDRINWNGSRKTTELVKNIYALGRIIELSTEAISQDCNIALANFLNLPPNGTVFRFKRLKIHGNVMHSKEYTRVRVRNSFTVSYTGINGKIMYGLINYFLAYRSNTKPSETVVLAIITQLFEMIDEQTHYFPYDEITKEYMMNHFKVFGLPNFNSQRKAINVENILKLCIYMPQDNCAYVCHPPNLVEKE